MPRKPFLCQHVSLFCFCFCFCCCSGCFFSSTLCGTAPSSSFLQTPMHGCANAEQVHPSTAFKRVYLCFAWLVCWNGFALQICVRKSPFWTQKMVRLIVLFSNTSVSSISSTIWHLHASWRGTTFCLLVRTKMIKHQCVASVTKKKIVQVCYICLLCLFELKSLFFCSRLAKFSVQKSVVCYAPDRIWQWQRVRTERSVWCNHSDLYELILIFVFLSLFSPHEANKDEFEQSSMRCGRKLTKDGDVSMKIPFRPRPLLKHLVFISHKKQSLLSVLLEMDRL